MNRRRALRRVAAASAAALFPEKQYGANLDHELQIACVSERTVRLTFLPIQDEKLAEVPSDRSLVQPSWAASLAKLRRSSATRTVRSGALRILATPDVPSFAFETCKNEFVQKLKIDPATGILSFATGTAPLLALGEGGPQFDSKSDFRK